VEKKGIDYFIAIVARPLFVYQLLKKIPQARPGGLNENG